MPFYVHGLGVATPPHSISQEEACEIARPHGPSDAEQERQLRALYRLAGVGRRHSVLLEPAGEAGRASIPFFRPREHADDRGPSTQERLAIYERTAPLLAAHAGRAALADAGWSPGDVSHVVTVSCTGFAAPNFDVGLIRALELAPSVERTHIGFMGCHGALNGLRVARACAERAPEAGVLVCAVEICSIHFQYGWNPDWLVANAIFADGAAAVAGAGRAPGRGTDREPWQLAGSGAGIVEDSADLMTWKIGDHGFEMSLSARVPGVIERQLRPWLDTWLAGHGLDVSQVASWALHPGGPRILEACVSAIGITRDETAVSREVLRTFGNMSSPTVLFILERLRRQGAPRPCVALGFGPGLAVEAALFR